MQILPHCDVDMWGVFERAWTSLKYYKDYLFGFETLVFVGYLCTACNTPKRKKHLKSHHMKPLNSN